MGRSLKRIEVRCEFCLQDFETSSHSINANPEFICCKKCSSIASSYFKNNIDLNKTDYYKLIFENYIHNANKINEEITLKKFGYTSDILGPKSSKKVIAKCEFCLQDKIMSMSNINSNKIVSCSDCRNLSCTYIRDNLTCNKNEFYLSHRQNVDLKYINLERTVELFGTDVCKLVPGSSKKVSVNCEFCSCEIITAFRYYVRFGCSISCNKCRNKKVIRTLQRKYGVSSVLQIDSVQAKLKYPDTEKIVADLLENTYDVDFVRQKSVGPYSFDFFLPKINLLIECQGDYFHDFKSNGYSGTPKDRSKATYIERYTDHSLLWIWEHEIHIGRIRKILDYNIHNRIEPKIDVSLSDVSISKIDNKIAHSFLSNYHYLGGLGTASVCLGAFFENQIISVCTFGNTTRQMSFKKVSEFLGEKIDKKSLKELRRFCIKPNVQSKNLGSFLISKYIKNYILEDDVKYIMSFSDPTVCDDGTIYKASNWRQLSNSSKSYHYIDPTSNKMIHKKTIYHQALKAHMKESEFVKRTGLSKVEELPKRVWLYSC